MMLSKNTFKDLCHSSKKQIIAMSGTLLRAVEELASIKHSSIEKILTPLEHKAYFFANSLSLEDIDEGIEEIEAELARYKDNNVNSIPLYNTNTREEQYEKLLAGHITSYVYNKTLFEYIAAKYGIYISEQEQADIQIKAELEIDYMSEEELDNIQVEILSSLDVADVVNKATIAKEGSISND